MTFFRVILATLFLVAVGCEKPSDTKKGDIEKAERLVKLGEHTKAIQAYEAALDGTVKTADVHYRIALIYDDKLKAPLDAIHHYERYLDFNPSDPQVPDSKQVADAKSARKVCEKTLQAKMNNEGFMPQSQAAKMRRDFEELLAENNYHKGILKEKDITFKPFLRITTADKAAKELPPGTKEYKVKRGDTLASIAFVVYKNRGLAGHIKDANQVQLKGTDKIFEGQTLIIPDPPRR